MCVCVYMCVFTLPIGPQPYPVTYAVVSSVRGLLDRKTSEEYLQSSNESIKKKNKANTTKRKGRKTKKSDARIY